MVNLEDDSDLFFYLFDVEILFVYQQRGANYLYGKVTFIFIKIFWPPEPELKTLKWWISRLMPDPLFFLLSRLT